MRRPAPSGKAKVGPRRHQRGRRHRVIIEALWPDFHPQHLEAAQRWETRSTRISNPLQTRYWSMVPYQLGVGSGRQAVKYSARACSATVDSMPSKPEHDCLRGALRNTLQNGDACMEFLVQPRTSNSMDVEDSRTEWKEAQAPFYPVATVRFPRQVFDTPEQNTFCENLSFTPWHALPQHRPLGVTNRLRKVIYDHISRVRHTLNGAERQEPQ